MIFVDVRQMFVSFCLHRACPPCQHSRACDPPRLNKCSALNIAAQWFKSSRGVGRCRWMSIVQWAQRLSVPCVEHLDHIQRFLWVKRCQMSRDVKRCQEMSRDVKRCQEMSRVKSNYWKPPEPQNQWSGSESVTSWSSCALRECLEWSSLAAALLLQQCWCLWIWYTWQIDAKQVYELYNREKRHIWTTPLFFWTDIAGSEFCGEKQTRAPSQNLPRCWQRSPWFQRRLKKTSCSL